MKLVPFDQLTNVDKLVLDVVYEGGIAGNAGDDPISKLVSCGNQGGFRSVGHGQPVYVVLYTSMEDPDWPDSIDLITGAFTYYGDNKRPGHDLHDPRGNKILRDIFTELHTTPQQRESIPPFLVFSKYPAAGSRSVQFRGLAVPGSPVLSPTDDLVAIWKSTSGSRFQNYRATFTILNISSVSQKWFADLRTKDNLKRYAPEAWTRWIETGNYQALHATPTIRHRLIQEQLPSTDLETQMLFTIYNYFQANPTGFEHCAAAIAQLADARIIIDEITRATIDGGRDAIGRYKLGIDSDPVYVDFALEAKCYRPDNPEGHTGTRVGVRGVARLISRLRHRQFGILVTTSAVAPQAYKELREDGHPIIILAGKDIIKILRSKDIGTVEAVENWLLTNFPN